MSTVRDHLLGTLAAEQTDLSEASSALIDLALTSSEELRPALAATAAMVLALSGDGPAAVWALIDLAQGEPLADLLVLGLQFLDPETLRAMLVEALPEVQARIAAG